MHHVRTRVLGVALLAGAAHVAVAAEPAQYPVIHPAGPVNEVGFVGFIDAAKAPVSTLEGLPRATARQLSGDDATGRGAYVVEFPAGFRIEQGTRRYDQSVEIVLLDGEMTFGDDTLHKYDFAFVPPGGDMPALAAAKPAKALVFFDPPVADADAVAKQRAAGRYVTHYEESRWRAGTVARDAGHPLNLAVQDMKQDPATTARTWLLKAGPNLVVPWERHSVVEEGYLIEGDYRLPECLPSGEYVGDYTVGGYFRRPANIIHSGPESGTKHAVLWLIRSYPAALDVKFEPRCRWLDPSELAGTKP